MFDHYAEYEYALASSQLLFAMFGMGALLAPSDFAAVFRRPRELAVGLILQWGMVPAVAVGVVALLVLPPGIAAGLALVAAVPGGTMSNVFTYLARGNIALSISLTAITTVASLAVTPILLRVLAGTHLPPGFEMPVGRIAFEIGVVLLIPLCVGMGAGALWPTRRGPISRISIRISFVCIAAMVIGSAGAGRLDVEAYGVVGPVAVALLCALFQLLAWAVTRAARIGRAESVAISIEVTIRNANLAVMVKASLFPAVTGVADPIGDGMFFVALLYGGVALPLSMIPVWLGRTGGPVPGPV